MLGQVEQADVEGAHKQAVSFHFLFLSTIYLPTLSGSFYLFYLCFAGQGVLLD